MDRRQGPQREDILEEIRQMRQDFQIHIEVDRQQAEKVDEYHKRFDRHVEIYSTNGKEMKRLADAVGSMHSQVDEMYEPYRDAKGVARSIKWGVGILLGLASVIGAIKYLIIKYLLKI